MESKEPFQQNGLGWCQQGGIVTMIHSALEPHISIFLLPFRTEAKFPYAQTYYPWFFFFLNHTIVCSWFVYFYSHTLLLSIRDIFSDLPIRAEGSCHSSSLVPVSLSLLLLCLGGLWLLLFWEDHNSQSPNSLETLHWSRRAFSLYLVWGLCSFRGTDLDPSALKFETFLFDCCLTGEEKGQ